MNTIAMSTVTTRGGIIGNRWMQLSIGIVCMAMVANLQYGWTLFVNPINAKYGWGLVAIQVAFTIFIMTETWLMPVEGYLVDRFGPKPVVMGSGILVALSWVINAKASSLPVLYMAAALGGLGAGGVVGACSGNSLKWFPDRRGLAAGLTAMGFGAGSALTIIPIANMIKARGYEETFFTFGLIQGAVVFVLSWFMFAPKFAKNGRGAGTVMEEKPSCKPIEMLKSLPFWMLYAIFILVSAGGLMVIAQIAPIAKDMKIADVPVTMLGLTMPALIFAMMIDRILNGVTRPFFGWVSDKIGRENTMFIAFALEAIGIWALATFGQNPIVFVLLTGVVFFAWGEIFSIFPATIGDTFGPKYAATNASIMLTAKGTSSLVVPLSGVVMAMTGSWYTVFIIAAAMNLVAAVLALALKPVRARFISQR